MATYTLTINGEKKTLNVEPDTALLWVLREHLGLTGTKYSCGKSYCGACTVHLDGKPIRACVMPISAVEKRSITTIEGLSANADHPLQKAWLEEQGRPMRLLPIRPNHASRCPTERKEKAQSGRNHQPYERRIVPLWNLYAHPQSH